MNFTKLYNDAYYWTVVHGSKLVLSIIILLVGLKLIKILRRQISNRLSKRKVHSSLQPFFLSVSITALYILLIILVLSIVGVPINNFTTIVGAFSVAAGLALSGTLQNFAGGVLILLLRPFEIDDSIAAQGQEGRVTAIQIFYTVLLTPDNKTVIIPNGKLFNEVIVNVSREGTRRLDIEIKLSYAADVQKVKQIMLNAIKATGNVLDNSANRVGISALEIDGIKFIINVWVNPADFLTVKLALQEKIICDLANAGVKLPGT